MDTQVTREERAALLGKDRVEAKEPGVMTRDEFEARRAISFSSTTYEQRTNKDNISRRRVYKG